MKITDYTLMACLLITGMASGQVAFPVPLLK